MKDIKFDINSSKPNTQTLLSDEVYRDLFLSNGKKVLNFLKYDKMQYQFVLKLPYKYSDFIKMHFSKKCLLCKKYPLQVQKGFFFCVLCFSNICYEHKYRNQKHLLALHANEKHQGATIYVNYKNMKIVIINGNQEYYNK